MIGTWINAGAVAAGALLGLWVGGRLPERYARSVLMAMGLVTLAIGASMAVGAREWIVVVVALVGGTIVGEVLHIDRGLDRLAGRLKGNREGRFVEGFVTTSLLFCVGSMSILGPVQEVLEGDRSVVLTKSVMDGISSIFFAASMGVGVLFSAGSILVYQGAVALGAGWLAEYLSGDAATDLTATGGVLLVGLGLSILEIKQIKVVNMLPALVFAVLLSFWL